MNQTIKNIPEEIKSLLERGFEEVSKEFVLKLRITRKQFYLIKIGEKFYVSLEKTEIESESKIPKNKKSLEPHHCSSCANFYNKKRGCLCPKVADGSEEACRRYTGSDIEALAESKRMEKYPFITIGFEEVNIPDGSFIVLGCTSYEEEKKDSERESKSTIGGAAYYDRNESSQMEENCSIYHSFRFNP